MNISYFHVDSLLSYLYYRIDDLYHYFNRQIVIMWLGAGFADIL